MLSNLNFEGIEDEKNLCKTFNFMKCFKILSSSLYPSFKITVIKFYIFCSLFQKNTRGKK